MVSFVGGPAVRTVIVTVLGLLFLRRRQWRQVVLVVSGVGGVGLRNTIVKKIVGRRRPRPKPRLPSQASHDSFPSGHSSGTLTLAGVVVYLLWTATRRRFVLLVSTAVGTFLTLLVGFSRMVLHKHHPGDVLAGYVLGAAWLAGTLRWTARLNRSRASSSTLDRSRRPSRLAACLEPPRRRV